MAQSQLNFPQTYPIRLQERSFGMQIFCPLRKKWLVHTPEEWVRQHVIQYLILDLGYSKTAITSEKILNINGLSKRTDVVVFRQTQPIILVECKAPSVKITQETFDQIARYNFILRSDFLMVTNGLNHFFCRMDYEKECYHFLEELPTKKDWTS